METFNALATRIMPFIGASLGAYIIYFIGQKFSGAFFKQNTTARVKKNDWCTR